MPYGVEPIIKYIPKDAVVWCPFDKENSEFVQQIVANGNKVVCSHIDNGQDFYSFEPDEHWDVIVSNEAVICGLTPEKACNIKEFAA